MISDLAITKHGIKRCQQRGIPLEVLPFIVKYGKRITTHNDNKSYINNKLLKALSRDHHDVVSKYDKHIKSTAVIWSSDKIITAYKICRRNNWTKKS